VRLLKKTFAFFLIPLLSIFASGVSVHAHFCKGTLVEANLFLPVEGCEMSAAPTESCTASDDSEACGTADHVKKPGCCEDHSDFFQLPTFSKSQQPIVADFSFAAVLPTIEVVGNNSANQAAVAAPIHGPPDKPTGQTKRILFQSFLC